MIEIERPRIECEEISDSYGRFVVEPLERGFGTTLGNSLRRVLLSSLPGVAASAIRIDGVLHEFTTIEGVREDVTEIVLNIKELCVKLHSEGPKKVTISAHGECEVKAGDITADSDVEIMNPDLHIASLGPNGKLEMEIILEHGRGYVSADKNKLFNSVDACALEAVVGTHGQVKLLYRHFKDLFLLVLFLFNHYFYALNMFGQIDEQIQMLGQNLGR